MRRTRKWSSLTNHVRTPNGWSRHCSPDGHENPAEPGIAPPPVHRPERREQPKTLRNLGLHRRRFIDPNGENNRKPQVIVAKRPGQMVHVDIKKSEEPRTAAVGVPTAAVPTRRNDPSAGKRRTSNLASATPTCIPRSTATQGWRTPSPRQRNRRNGHRFHEQRTPLLRCTRNHSYRACDHRQRIMLSGSRFHRFMREARHYRIKPYAPKHNGKVERYNRILAEELLYSREQQRRTAVEVWNVHYNHHRPHSTRGGRPPAAYRRYRVANVRASYS